MSICAIFSTLFVLHMDSMDKRCSIFQKNQSIFRPEDMPFQFLSERQHSLHIWKFRRENNVNSFRTFKCYVECICICWHCKINTYSNRCSIGITSSLSCSAPATIWQINDCAHLSGSFFNILFQSIRNSFECSGKFWLYYHKTPLINMA